MLLDALTHEAYAVDDACIAHNSHQQCVRVPYEAFEKLASRGCSAETLLDYLNSVDGRFHFGHVAFLTLREAEPAAPEHVWALRIFVELDPHFWYFNENDPLRSLLHMGHEFLWLWPPSIAFHAYLDYKEKRRRRQLDTHALDAVRPSMAHVAGRPGTGFRPCDLNGATRVPWDALTAGQRFFASCVEPQPTPLQRRLSTDTWTSRVARADQCALRSYRSAQEPAARLEARLRQLTFWLDRKPRGDPPATEFAHRMVAETAICPRFDGFDGFDWPALPEEIAHRILCTALASAMVADTSACADTICALREVSRAVRDTTEGFVGITLRIVTDAVRALCIDNSATSPLHTGMRARGIGLNTRLAMVLASTKHHTLNNGAVAAFPAAQAARNRVPCWQIYLRIRSAHEERTGASGAGYGYRGGKAMRCARYSNALARASGVLAHTLLSEVCGG